jgi:DNA (cytosine-5)-methyltransferase 1
MGYSHAGFEVVGVDIEPQPNYPFTFVQADALAFLHELVSIGPPSMQYEAIHASPPCQAYSALSWHPQNRNGTRPRLIESTRRLLKAARLPYVIENVPHSPLCDPVTLCGSSFGLPLRRHRWFETNWLLMPQPCAHDSLPRRFRVYRHGKTMLTRFVPVYGEGGGKAADHWPEALGIDWMKRFEMAEAIPPAYTEYIGAQLLAVL